MVDYIDGHREEFGVEPICTVLQFAPSTYYAVKTRPPSVRQIEDEENTAFSHLEDAAPAVELANALVRRFPEGRRLEFIHMPFAHGSQPPSVEASFYTPLGRLRLPDGVRFVAGFVHEAQPLETQHRVRSLIEDQIGHPVDIAAACGLGRRNRDAARRNLDRGAS